MNNSTQTNFQILEALLNRELQTEQLEEINNLPKLNHSNPQISNRVFFLDEDETPNLIGYASPEFLESQEGKELLSASHLIINLPKFQIYGI